MLTFRLGLESLVGGLSKQVVDALKKLRRRGVGDVRLSGLLNNDFYVVDGVEVVLISVKKRDDKVVVSPKPHEFQKKQSRRSRREKAIVTLSQASSKTFASCPGYWGFVSL